MFQGFLAAVVVIGFPALVVGVALARYCGADRDSVVLGPVAGLAVLLLALRLAQLFDATAQALTATALAVGIGALPLALREPRSTWLRILPATIGAALCLLVLVWPWTHLDGEGVLGYNMANDATKHGAWIASIADGEATQVSTAYAQTVSLFSGGYPSGGHLLAASISLPAGGVVPAYMPAMAVLMAFLAFPAYWLVRRSGGPVAIGILACPLVGAGYLQVAYYLEAFLPQMMAGAALMGALALGYEAAASRRVAPAALAGACMGFAVQAYSANVLLWSGPLIAVVIAMRVRDRATGGLRVLGMQAAAALLVLLVVTAPVLRDTIDYLTATNDVAGSQSELGNIRRPLDLRTLFGTFVGIDYRELVPLEKTISNIGSVAAALLAAAGVVISVRRRQYALVTLLACYAVATLFVIRSANVYYEAKSYQLLAMPIAAAVAVGAGGLMSIGRGRARVACALAGLALLGLHLQVVRKAVGLEIAERSIRTPDQVTDLPRIAARVPAATGISLLVEDWVKALLPPAISPYDGYRLTGLPVLSLRSDPSGTPLLGANWADFDAFEPWKTVSVASIVEYRLATHSIPPPPFVLAYETPRLRVWTSPGGSLIASRIPLEEPGVVGGRVLAPGASMPAPEAAGTSFRLGARPLDGVLLIAGRDLRWQGTRWARWDADGSYLATAADTPDLPATATVDLPLPGTYRIVVGGGVQRDDAVAIDGRRFGMREATAAGTFPYGVNSVQYVGEIDLDAGSHRVEFWGQRDHLSLVRAISLELRERPPPAPVCIGSQRHTVAWDAPASALDVATGAAIVNCGDTPLLLDWIEPLPS